MSVFNGIASQSKSFPPQPVMEERQLLTTAWKTRSVTIGLSVTGIVVRGIALAAGLGILSGEMAIVAIATGVIALTKGGFNSSKPFSFKSENSITSLPICRRVDETWRPDYIETDPPFNVRSNPVLPENLAVQEGFTTPPLTSTTLLNNPTFPLSQNGTQPILINPTPVNGIATNTTTLTAPGANLPIPPTSDFSPPIPTANLTQTNGTQITFGNPLFDLSTCPAISPLQTSPANLNSPLTCQESKFSFVTSTLINSQNIHPTPEIPVIAKGNFARQLFAYYQQLTNNSLNLITTQNDTLVSNTPFTTNTAAIEAPKRVCCITL